MNCILLTSFVDLDFWQSIDVECSAEAEQIVVLHFARTIKGVGYGKVVITVLYGSNILDMTYEGLG